MIGVGASLDQQQMRLEHEQNVSALDAIGAADADIRKHGLAIEKKTFEEQAAQIKAQADAQRQAAILQQQHEQRLQQQGFDAQNQALQNEMKQQQALQQTMASTGPATPGTTPASPTQPTPPTGVI
jgi:hypothetical protein